MEYSNEQLPPLAPDRDPTQIPQQQPEVQVQPFQESVVAPSSPLHTPQQSDQQRATISRSRASSVNKPILHQPQPQPIRDAVDRAFGQSQPPNTLDPAFIAQVTEAVVKNLQNANLSQRTPAPSFVTQYPPPPSVHSVPQSPTLSSTSSLPPSITSPSPSQGKNNAETRREVSSSPVPIFPDNEPMIGKSGFSHARNRLGDIDGQTPKPAFDEAFTRPKPQRSTSEGQETVNLSKAEEGLATETTPGRRDSHDSVDRRSDTVKVRAYPSGQSDQPVELTTLEKIWQPLFDNGIPTIRLSQFLRGIALHIIEDYEPKNSLVIVPHKILRFFEQTKIQDELYPWHLIFGGGMVSASISVMFRRLKCQHHLVQTQLHEVPNVPGLTPMGFETFMTCLIQAHPDLEFERLSNAVKNMPISNADYKTERFPKELSRRLIPTQANPAAEQCMIASMAHEATLLQLRNSTAMPPPPPSAPPQHSAFQERERKPYSQSSFSTELDEEYTDDFMPSVAIERERKPYSAKEGTGKIYTSESAREDPSSVVYPRPADPAQSRASRSTNYDYYPTSSTQPDRSVPHPGKHRSSVGSGLPSSNQIPNNGYARGRRSPPPIGSHARSDPVNVGDIPVAQYNSNLHGPRPQGQIDRDQENAGYHSNRHNSNIGNGIYDDEISQASGKARPIPNKGNQVPPPTAASGFDSSYGSASTSSYPGPRPRNYDRRSMYAASPSMNSGIGPGGSDGWGSFANGNGASGVNSSQPGYGSAGMQH